MQNLFKLARRNIWRNKRRTLITVASIFFAVFFACLMNSMQKGTWDNMVNSVISYYFGYAQIHKKGYWEDLSLDKSMQYSALKEFQDLNVKNVSDFVPRLESFALASHEINSKGVLVVGIDPIKEDQLTSLKSKMTKGSYITADKDAALVAEGLAEYLKVGVGDSLILIGQGYHGANAAGKYIINGLVKFGSPELNKQMVYLPLATAQWFYAADDLITSLVVNTDAPKKIKSTIQEMRSQVSADEYEVMDWEELIPELVEARELDSAGGQFVLYILYIIIGFGIFGTLLMMLKEREYEFGVMLSIGMKKYQIFFMVWLETIFLGILGVLLGVLVSGSIIYYFSNNPVELTGDMATAYEQFGVQPLMAAAFESNIFMTQAITIFVILTILSLYPFIKIRQLEPVKAMRK